MIGFIIILGIVLCIAILSIPFGILKAKDSQERYEYWLEVGREKGQDYIIREIILNEGKYSELVDTLKRVLSKLKHEEESNGNNTTNP
jgi:hypothetical protein